MALFLLDALSFFCVYSCVYLTVFFFFFSSRRRHTRCLSDWSSDVCSSDLPLARRPTRCSALSDGSRPEPLRIRPSSPPHSRLCCAATGRPSRSPRFSSEDRKSVV